jgi:hypothetical protein
MTHNASGSYILVDEEISAMKPGVRSTLHSKLLRIVCKGACGAAV